MVELIFRYKISPNRINKIFINDRKMNIKNIKNQSLFYDFDNQQRIVTFDCQNRSIANMIIAKTKQFIKNVTWQIIYDDKPPNR